MYFVDETNGDMYREMHVNKNLIQREILNPDTPSFVYPIPPPEPVVEQQPAAQQDDDMDDDY